MNILLTGLITPMISAMIPRLQRNAHHVTISAAGLYEADENKAPNKTKRITKEVQKILQGKRYQALIFFYAYQCEETMDDVSVQGTMLDDLFEYQQAAAQHGVKHFILITDQRVFGSVQDLAESQAPAPDTSAGILIKAAEDYLLSSGADEMEKLIIRVTNLYMPGQQDAFFSRALICAQNNEPMLIEATEETPCDFLHADDLAQCICLAIESDISGIVHLAYEDQSTYKSAMNLVLKHLPGLTVTYSGKSERYESLKTSQAVKRLDWVPRHHWMQELGEILAVDDEKLQKRNPLHFLTNQGNRLLSKTIPWIELVLFGGLAFWLTSISKVYANFRIADYWLFYPILMGSLHGGPIGIAAGLIACTFFGLDWVREGNDLYRLLYNIDNWLPLMMYMLAGGLFGYMHDKTNERMKMLEEEMREHDAKTTFMEKMYQQASEDSVLLQKQVLNNRDSFGRIFNITMELESMQPEQVYLSTLNVLEDTMQNHSVAIYSRSGYTSYARLAASSPKYGGKLSKSLDVAQFPLMKSRLDRGECFTNTSLEPGYPAFSAPVMHDNRAIAMIALWEVPFDQQTLYHQNLFKVVAGLVQSAMVRTLLYFNHSKDMYLMNTHIMTAKSFQSALDIYLRMKKQRISDYTLLRVSSMAEDISLSEIDQKIGNVIRSTDHIGLWEDETCFVLLPQAVTADIPKIENRLMEAGFSCEVVLSEAVYE